MSLCFLAFMTKAGLSLSLVGLVMMANRMASVITNLFLGEWIQNKDPVHTIIFSEIINIFVALALIFLWPKVFLYKGVFILFVFLRSGLIAVTIPSQQKIIKFIAYESSEKLKNYTVLMNWVNYGSGVFAAIISYYAINNRSFEFILAIDGITFLANGILIFSGLRHVKPKSPKRAFVNPLTKFNELRKIDTRLFYSDILLHLNVFGTNIFMIRLSKQEPSWIPIFLISFALAVWISTLLHRFCNTTSLVKYSWAGFPISFLWLYIFSNFLFFIFYFGWNIYA